MSAICGGNLTIWAFLDTRDPVAFPVANPKDQTDIANMDWVYLQHVDSWEIAQTTQEATRKRTSTTQGAAVKFCPDTVSYDLNVVNTITPDEQWLYGAILADYNKMAVGVTAWFFAGFDAAFNFSTGGASVPGATMVNGTAAGNQLGLNGSVGNTFSHVEGGFYMFGTVVPPGFSGSNDGQDPVTGEWSVSLSTTPLPPKPTWSAWVDGSTPVWKFP